MSKTGAGMATYAKNLLGTPYFYGAKISYGVLTENYMSTMHKYYPSVVTKSYMQKARNKKQVGKQNVDCSGVTGGYRKKELGSAQLYAQAKKRMPISEIKDFAIGTTLYKNGHIGTYIGMESGIPMCIEAKGIDYGTIKSRVADTKWTHGLTFSDITYDYAVKVQGTSKGKNPYTKPSGIIKKGMKGDGVKWVQWELREAGYDVPFKYKGISYSSVKVDGDAGPITDAAIRSFQKSCKITVDGQVGNDTKKCLIADK